MCMGAMTPGSHDLQFLPWKSVSYEVPSSIKCFFRAIFVYFFQGPFILWLLTNHLLDVFWVSSPVTDVVSILLLWSLTFSPFGDKSSPEPRWWYSCEVVSFTLCGDMECLLVLRHACFLNLDPTLHSLCVSLSPPLEQHQQEPLMSCIVMYTQCCPKLKFFGSYMVFRCCLINTYDYLSIPFASSQEGPDVALISSLPVLLINTCGIFVSVFFRYIQLVLLRVAQRHRTNRNDFSIVVVNWLTRFWRLRKLQICFTKLETKESWWQSSRPSRIPEAG